MKILELNNFPFKYDHSIIITCSEIFVVFVTWFIFIGGQMNALKDLGLDVAKGTVLTEGPVKQTKFFITRL